MIFYRTLGVELFLKIPCLLLLSFEFIDISAIEMTASHCSSVAFIKTPREPAYKSPIRRKCIASQISILWMGLMCFAAADGVSDNFTYIDNGADVTITGYVIAPVGSIVIPATIFDPVTQLNDPVTVIDAYAFADCIELTSVTIPYGVTSIGLSAFSGCSQLVSTTIPSSVTGIGRLAFSSCINLTSMSLPYGVATIGSFAFGGCISLTSVSIPASVTSIGNSAFGNCTSLTNMNIPSSVTTIGQSVFNGCSGLTSVTIPSSVTSIGLQAFQYCGGLTSVSLPSSVTILKSKAFANCKGLTTIALPANVATIETEVFRDCSSLTSITVDGTNLNYSSLDGVLFNKAQSTLIAFPAGRGGSYVIPQSVTTIGNVAFFTCEKLLGVTFPYALASIQPRAFSTCSKLINAVFLDDPPAVMGSSVFELAGSGFVVGYLKSGTGFTSPVWSGYPSYQVAAITPEFTWLVSNAIPGNTNFLSDANGDGVNLLMAYALNMNPNARNSLPQLVLGASQMSLSFYSATPGVTYGVRTSNDMLNWTAEGVTLSGPMTNRTATVAISGQQRFMRLEVSH